jgi:hypothetical protein
LFRGQLRPHTLIALTALDPEHIAWERNNSAEGTRQKLSTYS